MEIKIARIGKISSVDVEKARVQVLFTDIDNMVSVDLPLIFPQGLKNKCYAIPDIGENVLCLFMEQGLSDGFCIGSFYTDDVLPPVSSQDKIHYAFEDGTFIEYDRKEHKLTADIKGDADIKVKKVNVQADDVTTTCKNLTATSLRADITATDVSLNCTTLTINAEKEILIKSGTQVTIQGKTQTQVVS